MKVSKDKVVSMHYTLKNDAGEVIDSSDGKETLDFLQGHGNIIPGLESALEGSSKGDKMDYLWSLKRVMDFVCKMRFKRSLEQHFKALMK